MGVKLLWYLTGPDGPYPWEPEGRLPTDFAHLQELAKTIDRLGYFGALLGTGDNEVLTVAASMISVTEKMRFLAALYPGLIAPAKLAQIVQTIDRFSGGRLLLNVVNGQDPQLLPFGLHIPHDERYEYSLDYWRAFKELYPGNTRGYRSSRFDIAPAPADGGLMGNWLGPQVRPSIPLWGAGTSPAGVQHSVRLLDVYLSFANTPPLLGQKFARVASEAAALGRTLHFGTRLQVIVRETEEEAWRHADWLLSKASHDYIHRSIRRQLPPGTDLATFRSDDPQIQRNIDTVRSGRLPTARDLEIYPNVWIGPGWFNFDLLGPLTGTCLVGSAHNVAERIREFAANGVEAFILSGFPLIEEAHRVADLLFPLLDLDHDEWAAPAPRATGGGLEQDGPILLRTPPVVVPGEPLRVP
jgi:alkanesulfonate monooxygenase